MHQVAAVMLRLSHHEPRDSDTGRQHTPSRAAWEARQATVIKLVATLAWLGPDAEPHVGNDDHNQGMHVKCKELLWDLLDFLLTDQFDNPELDMVKVELLSCNHIVVATALMLIKHLGGMHTVHVYVVDDLSVSTYVCIHFPIMPSSPMYGVAGCWAHPGSNPTGLEPPE